MKGAQIRRARQQWVGVRAKWIAFAQRSEQNPAVWAAVESLVEDVDAILPLPEHVIPADLLDELADAVAKPGIYRGSSK